MERPKTCAYGFNKIDNTPARNTEQNKPQKIYAYMECINVESS